MALNQLSERTVKIATVTKGERLLCDGGGLYLRVRLGKGSPVKHWLFIFTAPDGKRKKIALGDYPAHSLSDARTWAADQRKQVDNGIDPVDAKRRAKQERLSSVSRTCGALLGAYVSNLKANRKQSAADAESILSLHVPENVKQLDAAAVTHHDLNPLLRKLIEAGKLRTAAKLRSYLRAAFELALGADGDPNAPSTMLGFRLVANPAARIKVPKGAGGTPGERALSRQELAEYKVRLEALPMDDMRDLLRLQLLLAGQRINQLLTATIEPDTEGNPLIVMRDSKGRRQQPRRHALPLRGEALAIVEARGSRLFGWNDQKDIKREQLNASALVGKKICPGMLADEKANAPFRMGDIRRTAETMLASIGISQDVRAQLLSHGLGGVQNRHYDKHDYMKEKTQALAAWERLLNSPDIAKVVPINSKTA